MVSGSARNKSFCRNSLVLSLIDGVDFINDGIAIERIHVVVSLLVGPHVRERGGARVRLCVRRRPRPSGGGQLDCVFWSGGPSGGRPSVRRPSDRVGWLTVR